MDSRKEREGVGFHKRLRSNLKKIAALPLLKNTQFKTAVKAWQDTNKHVQMFEAHKREEEASKRWPIQISLVSDIDEDEAHKIARHVMGLQILVHELFAYSEKERVHQNFKTNTDYMKSADIMVHVNKMDNLPEIYDHLEQFCAMQKLKNNLPANNQLVVFASALQSTIALSPEYKKQILQRDVVEPVLAACETYKTHVKNKMTSDKTTAAYRATFEKLEQATQQLQQTRHHSTTTPEQAREQIQAAQKTIESLIKVAPKDSALKKFKDFVLKALTFGRYKKTKEKFAENMNKFFKDEIAPEKPDLVKPRVSRKS